MVMVLGLQEDCLELVVISSGPLWAGVALKVHSSDPRTHDKHDVVHFLQCLQPQETCFTRYRCVLTVSCSRPSVNNSRPCRCVLTVSCSQPSVNNSRPCFLGSTCSMLSSKMCFYSLSRMCSLARCASMLSSKMCFYSLSRTCSLARHASIR